MSIVYHNDGKEKAESHSAELYLDISVSSSYCSGIIKGWGSCKKEAEDNLVTSITELKEKLVAVLATIPKASQKRCPSCGNMWPRLEGDPYWACASSNPSRLCR